MKRVSSKATLLKKRVRIIQNRAKFVGMLYLIGLLALMALVVCMPLLKGTAIAPSGKKLVVLSFYQPFIDIFKGGIKGLKSLSIEKIDNAFVALVFAILLLTMLIDFLRSLGKLGWLFKRRASYINGFNRNMYAMDDMGKRFTWSFVSIIASHVIIYIVTGTAKLTNFAYVTLGVGLGIHFIAGLIGGTVTIFTTEEQIEEQTRDYGVFVYFVRNALQLAVVGAVLFFLIKESVLFAKCRELLDMLVVKKAGVKVIKIKEYLPAIVELFAWIWVLVLMTHTLGATEYNRDCSRGAGMANFAVFSLLLTLTVGALVAFPYLKIGTTVATLNKNLLIVAIVAFGGFLLDCIIRPRSRELSQEEMDVEEYFRGGNTRYNNTII